MTENTRKFYGRDITELLTYLRERAYLVNPAQVGTFHLEQYLARLDECGLKGSSGGARWPRSAPSSAFCTSEASSPGTRRSS
jgi:site-specific recombinase XerD